MWPDGPAGPRVRPGADQPGHLAPLSAQGAATATVESSEGALAQRQGPAAGTLFCPSGAALSGAGLAWRTTNGTGLVGSSEPCPRALPPGGRPCGHHAPWARGHRLCPRQHGGAWHCTGPSPAAPSPPPSQPCDPHAVCAQQPWGARLPPELTLPGEAGGWVPRGCHREATSAPEAPMAKLAPQHP